MAMIVSSKVIAQCRPRLTGTVMILVCLFAFLLPSDGRAHDPRRQLAPQDRMELSFGRSEEHDYDPPEPGSYRLPPIKEAADGILLDREGRPQSLQTLFKDRITVMAFIYTRCSDPQGCPLSMGLMHDLHAVAEQDPVIGKALQLMTVSFDPEFDTPEVMKAYSQGMLDDTSPERWRVLTAASEAALKPILAAYGQQIQPKKNADDRYGPIAHMLRVILIDREGLIRNIYSLGFMDPRLVLTDVRTLLLEEAGITPGG